MKKPSEVFNTFLEWIKPSWYFFPSDMKYGRVEMKKAFDRGRKYEKQKIFEMLKKVADK